MYIGVLNSKASGLKGNYCFMYRGTSHLFPPDKIFNSNGADNGEITFGSGSLCSGNPVGWKWDSLMDVGLDIRMDLSKECFIGAVCVGLADDSAVQTVEVFNEKDGNLRCIGRFNAQTNGLLEGEFTIPVGVNVKNLVIRFKAGLKDIVITKFNVIGAIPDLPAVYPTPASAKYSGNKIMLNTVHAIMACDDSEDSDFAARYLQERLLERFGIDLPIIMGESTVTDESEEEERKGKERKEKSRNKSIEESRENIISICICDIKDICATKDVYDAKETDICGAKETCSADEKIKKEGYKVIIDKGGVKLVASGKLSLLYAVETFVQLCKGGEIPICEIEDYPYMPIRGFHFGLPPREEIEFAKRLIRYVLIPMRYNVIFIEFAGGMRFDKHPEISEAWVQGNRAGKAGTQPMFPHGDMVAGGELLEKNEVRDFVQYAKNFGFEVIPEVQSFGHVQYMTYAHPEIAEIEEGSADKKMDTRSADQPPSTFYHHSYCPSNEKSYEIIYDIIDEIVEVVEPERYVHMGHDEIYQIGLCPRCKGKDHSDLYAKHVIRMYDYLKKKGLGMMIWCDMLQPTERYLTTPAITKIPKDIVMLDFIWYFHFDIDMEDHILPHGFNVIMGNMYSSHYPRFKSRIAKKGMIGGEVSTWCRFDEYNLAKKGKIFDLLYSAEMFWSDKYNSDARQVYTELIQKMIPQIRDELRGIAKPEGTAISSTPIALPKSSAPSLSETLGSVICNLGDNICGYSFDLSEAQRLSNTPIEVKVGDKFKKIIFLHTATNNAERVAWKPLPRIGEYIVKYCDNTEVVIPVEYAGNICVWTRRYAQPMPQQYYRHQGYTATYFSDPLIQAKSECGQDITLLGYDWVNPYPDREICSITCKGNDATDADILLFGLSGIK